MALEERLVDRHVLDPDDPLRPLDLENPVDQQERVPVRDHVQDPADVHRHASVALSGASEPSGQRNIALMARFGRDHVRLHPAADQRQVAQDVRRLVPDELVGPAQLPAHEAVFGQHERGVERGAERQAPGPQGIRLVQEAERPRPGELAAERLRRNVVAPRLSADQRMRPLDRGREPKRLGRCHDVARVGFRSWNGASTR